MTTTVTNPELMTGEGKALLCRILAEVDAVWRPWRNPLAPGWADLYELRRRYADKGLPWRSGGVGAAERQEFSRLLSGLARTGLVETFGGKDRVASIRLTVAGEAEARRLCILPGKAAALKLLAELAGLRAELGGVGRFGNEAEVGDWLPETLLCRCEWGEAELPERAWTVTLFAAPLLAAGLVEALADVQGHVYYRVTSAGVKAAKKPRPRKAWRWGLPTEDYCDRRKAHYEMLANTPSASMDTGEIPLPVAGWTREFLERYKVKMAALRSGGPAAPTGGGDVAAGDAAADKGQGDGGALSTPKTP